MAINFKSTGAIIVYSVATLGLLAIAGYNFWGWFGGSKKWREENPDQSGGRYGGDNISERTAGGSCPDWSNVEKVHKSGETPPINIKFVLDGGNINFPKCVFYFGVKYLFTSSYVSEGNSYGMYEKEGRTAGGGIPINVGGGITAGCQKILDEVKAEIYALNAGTLGSNLVSLKNVLISIHSFLNNSDCISHTNTGGCQKILDEMKSSIYAIQSGSLSSNLVSFQNILIHIHSFLNNSGCTTHSGIGCQKILDEVKADIYSLNAGTLGSNIVSLQNILISIHSFLNNKSCRK